MIGLGFAFGAQQYKKESKVNKDILRSDYDDFHICITAATVTLVVSTLWEQGPR